MNLAVALGLSIAASVAFAGAAVLQHDAIGDQIDDHRDQGHPATPKLGFGFFQQLLQRPRWWAGFGLSGLGAVLNLTALSGAPVAVVQPMTVLSVPFAVLLGMWLSHRRPNSHVWAGIAAAMVGVTVFVALAASNTASDRPATSHIIICGLIAAAFVAVSLWLGQRGPRWMHSLGWASGAAGAYGLAAAYMKAIFVQLEHNVAWTSPTVIVPAVVLLAAYPAAAYMLQHAFVSGAPEVVIGGLTVIDPILAVLLGAYLLGEGSKLSVPVLVVMAVCAGLAIVGIVVLSRYHPDAAHPATDPAPHMDLSPRTVPLALSSEPVVPATDLIEGRTGQQQLTDPFPSPDQAVTRKDQE